jgi:ATP-dependent DNA ligase
MLKRSRFLTPSASVSNSSPPSGDGWIHEVKFDGWRAQLHKSGDDVVIFSRNGADYTRRFRAVRDSMLRIALSQYSSAHADPKECQEAVERATPPSKTLPIE